MDYQSRSGVGNNITNKREELSKIELVLRKKLSLITSQLSSGKGDRRDNNNNNRGDGGNNKKFDKKREPYSNAVVLTALIQILSLTYILAILRYFFNLNPLLNVKKQLMFPIFFIAILLFFKIYTRVRVEKILEKYNNKSVREKYMWGVISICALLLPFIVVVVVFHK